MARQKKNLECLFRFLCLGGFALKAGQVQIGCILKRPPKIMFIKYFFGLKNQLTLKAYPCSSIFMLVDQRHNLWANQFFLKIPPT
jgi:hypothetical protein